MRDEEKRLKSPLKAEQAFTRATYPKTRNGGSTAEKKANNGKAATAGKNRGFASGLARTPIPPSLSVSAVFPFRLVAWRVCLAAPRSGALVSRQAHAPRSKGN